MARGPVAEDQSAVRLAVVSSLWDTLRTTLWPLPIPGSPLSPSRAADILSSNRSCSEEKKKIRVRRDPQFCFDELSCDNSDTKTNHVLGRVDNSPLTTTFPAVPCPRLLVSISARSALVNMHRRYLPASRLSRHAIHHVGVNKECRHIPLASPSAELPRRSSWFDARLLVLHCAYQTCECVCVCVSVWSCPFVWQRLMMHISAGISHSSAKVLACEVQITSTCVQGYFYLSTCRADWIGLTLCCLLRVHSSRLCCSVVLKFTRLKDFYLFFFFRNMSAWLTFFIRLI